MKRREWDADGNAIDGKRKSGRTGHSVEARPARHAARDVVFLLSLIDISSSHILSSCLEKNITCLFLFTLS
jgi:hypothetical protein